jgi:hypothetical protein
MTRREKIACFIAKHLPREIKYWVFIQLGVEAIHSDEVVPEVTYTEVLQRIAR